MSSTSNNIDFVVDSIDYVGLRVDTALSEILNVPRNRVQHYIEDRLIKVNLSVVKKNYKLKLNDAISVFLPKPNEDIIEKNDADIMIVYEDDDIVVIDKPAGLVVHPGAAKETVSVISALKYRGIELSSIGAPIRPGVVHRIDKNTSGIIVLAKTDKAHFILAKQFFSHTIDRRYIGIVYGNIKIKEGIVEKAIARNRIRRKEFCVSDRGKNAKTQYKVIKRLNGMDIVMFKLFTGRTHQIRIHMKYLNHPLIGDKIYGRKKENKIDRQALHAFRLGFMHPSSGDFMLFYSKLPEDMIKVIKNGG